MAIPKRQQTNKLRIIGGRLRGTKLWFPSVVGLRPTPDRVRETLFNWLQSDIGNARCLDLFAGSGALGLESISRGASFVVMVEQNKKAADCIKAHLERLHIDNAVIHHLDALKYLRMENTPSGFDIVYLDPPYQLNVLPQCITLLEQQQWLTPTAKIYIEAPSHVSIELPPNWLLHRHKKEDRPWEGRSSKFVVEMSFIFASED